MLVLVVCCGDLHEARQTYSSAENNGCTAVRFAYGGKGFSHEDVPLSMITGQLTVYILGKHTSPSPQHPKLTPQPGSGKMRNAEILRPVGILRNGNAE